MRPVALGVMGCRNALILSKHRSGRAKLVNLRKGSIRRIEREFQIYLTRSKPVPVGSVQLTNRGGTNAVGTGRLLTSGVSAPAIACQPCGPGKLLGDRRGVRISTPSPSIDHPSKYYDSEIQSAVALMADLKQALATLCRHSLRTQAPLMNHIAGSCG